MFDKHYIGLDLTGFENNGTLDKVSRITLMLDDGNALTAGDDTGMELVADCPHATQVMVNALLSNLQGFQYKMFSADDANIDPSAELGDGATAGGVYSIISKIEDDGSGYMRVAAPGEPEEKDEFPSAGPMTREINRQLASTRSSITKTAEQIRLEVSQTYATQSALGSTKTTLESSITQSADGIKSEVSKTYLTKTDAANTYQTSTQVSSAIKQSADSIISSVSSTYLTKDAAGKTYETITNVSKISQKVDSIKLSVSNGEQSSTIKLMAGSTEISSYEIKFTGKVLFASDLGEDGETEIDGGRITTGLIAADRIAADKLKVNAANITGTVVAEELQGDIIYLYDDNGDYAASFTINAASSAEYKLDIKADAIAITTESAKGILFLGVKDCGYFQLTSNHAYFGTSNSDWSTTSGNRPAIRPHADNTYEIGGSSYRWKNIYATNGTIQTSDKHKKRDIEYGLSKYDAFFDKLKPSSYKLVGGDRTHTGLVAQDIENLLEECGISTMDFAGFVKSEREDGTGYDYGLRYSEFIPLLIEQVQNLKNRVKELERHGNKKTA